MCDSALHSRLPTPGEPTHLHTWRTTLSLHHLSLTLLPLLCSLLVLPFLFVYVSSSFIPRLFFLSFLFGSSATNKSGSRENSHLTAWILLLVFHTCLQLLTIKKDLFRLSNTYLKVHCVVYGRHFHLYRLPKQTKLKRRLCFHD